MPKFDLIKEKTLETDTYFLAQLVGLTVNDNRMRLIVTKIPNRARPMKVLAKIKTVLAGIQNRPNSIPSIRATCWR